VRARSVRLPARSFDLEHAPWWSAATDCKHKVDDDGCSVGDMTAIFYHETNLAYENRRPLKGSVNSRATFGVDNLPPDYCGRCHGGVIKKALTRDSFASQEPWKCADNVSRRYETIARRVVLAVGNDRDELQ
jgi:hypothetical protein